MGAVEDQALRELSEEYGRQLDIHQDESSGQLLFKVVDQKKGEVLEELSSEESNKLQERLFTITQKIVDQNMI
jgi:uncharacterized FlaG/YvyC family protein